MNRLVPFLGGLALASAIFLIMRPKVEPPAAPPVPVAPPAAEVAAPAPPPPSPAPFTPVAPPRSRAGSPPPVSPAPEKPSASNGPAAAPAVTPAPSPAPPAPAPVASAPEPEPPHPADHLPTPIADAKPPKVALPERKVTIADGTVIPVILNEKISTETHKSGDAFSASLASPLIVDGLVIAERNARVSGRVNQSVESGKVKGVAQITLALTQITTSDGQKVPIRTATFVKTAAESKGKDAAKVGVGAALGAAIGAIAGGGKGAAIGAAAGGAAGTGAVVLTRGNPAELPNETRLSFRLTEAVTLTERKK